MKEVFFETAYVRIWFDEAACLGGAVWWGQLTSEEFRNSFRKCFKLVKEKKLKFWLADNRKLKAISADDHEWVLQMAPEVLASGLDKMATLVSEDIFMQMSVVSLFDEANSQLTFQNRFFQTEESALAWLKIAPCSRDDEDSPNPETR